MLAAFYFSEMSGPNNVFVSSDLLHFVYKFQVFACVSQHVQHCRTGEVRACKVSMDTWVGSYAAQQETFMKETILKKRKCKRLNLDT